jgi:DNA polymerase III epsilon subunit-like protein
MLDIETLGLEPGAAILSIGAVRFDAGTVDADDEFLRSVSLASCEQYGLEIDAETLTWWLDQDAAAQAQLTGGSDLHGVLREFSVWLDGAEEIWANSPAFDCVHLEHAYGEVALEVPWEYYQRRDYRTLSGLELVDEPEHSGTEHDALDDAVQQARVAATALEEVGSDV